MHQGVEHFLRSIAARAEGFDAVRCGGAIYPLLLNFWSFAEVEASSDLRAEWGIPEQQVPFWGDWHDLLCISIESGAVTYLNDQREVVCSWDSGDEFLESLIVEALPTVQPGGVGQIVGFAGLRPKGCGAIEAKARLSRIGLCPLRVDSGPCTGRVL